MYLRMAKNFYLKIVLTKYPIYLKFQKIFNLLLVVCNELAA